MPRGYKNPHPTVQVNKTVDARDNNDSIGQKVEQKLIHNPVTGKLDMPAPPEVEPIRLGGDIDALEEAQRVAAMEAFMNELVQINVAPGTPERGDTEFISLACNGRHQLVRRGGDIWVRRCFVEILAHAKTTSWEQRQNPQNPLDLSDKQMIPTHTFMYPFQVVQDTQRGRQWFEQLKAQPF